MVFHKKLLGKGEIKKTATPSLDKHSQATWQPDVSDIQRANERFVKNSFNIQEEVEATLTLGKALGIKFDKNDEEVRRFLRSTVANDAHRWESSSKQACL